MTGYPIQLAKVQVPVLRDQTLERDRLLDWLAAKVHHRVILVLADAGYGKTTLLADFSRRTRLRMLWYRLDDDDRDWISFLNHLIAAGREHDPGFAPRSAAMLSDLALGGPTREAATEVFLRELPTIAEHGAVLILDDFHVVDESPDVRQIVRDMVARAPERLCIAFASRRVPSIPLAKLRASGEVAEIGTDDLRFDATETERLFSETYGRALEPDVLADVAARTEGWAASLQLVQAALRDRSPAEIRRFVRGLNGADQELYDYLAEEVVGDLPDDMQQFLMRTSILQIVTPDLAGVVSGLEAVDVARLTNVAERLTLLTRPSRTSRGPQRYHPLVREFLEARLRLVEGDAAVATLHRQVGESAASRDWGLAAHHYREAGDFASVANVVEAALPQIMSKGAYGLAGEFISGLPSEVDRPGFGVVTSRLRMQAGDYEGAIGAAEVVLARQVAGAERDHALLSLLTLHVNGGDIAESLSLAEVLRSETEDANLKLIAEAVRLSVEAGSSGGNLDLLSAHFRLMAEMQRSTSAHHFGVTMLNLALISVLQDDPQRALTEQQAALEAFEATSASIELSSTLAARCATLAQIGRVAESDTLLASALERTDLRAEADLVLEAAEFQDSYGDSDTARALFDEVDTATTLNARHLWVRSFTLARHFVRRGRFPDARRLLDAYPSLASTNPGAGIARRVVVAHLATATGQSDARAIAEDARRIAQEQRSHRWRRVAELLVAYSGTPEELSEAVISAGARFPWHLTFLADLLSQRVGELTVEALDAVRVATALHPRRWQHSLRTQIDAPNGESKIAAGRLLEAIGDQTDVRRLRAIARSRRRTPGAADLGRGLARRLAPRVIVDDLGRMAIDVGGSVIPGTNLRRRVLALLTFVLTRQDFSCTRDQVLDAMWPDLDPSLAMNSLNQTVYFLRRVFEEDFNEDLSPGYVHHDAEVIWFDPELVSSKSAACSRMIRQMALDPSPDQVEALSVAYTARFALDFEYEEWAEGFRDWLHASYLQIVERAVVSDLGSGHFHRGIRIAQRALEVDPGVETVEITLLKLYRSSGAHAAAAEQYAHYAERLRNELDVAAPPLDSL